MSYRDSMSRPLTARYYAAIAAATKAEETVTEVERRDEEWLREPSRDALEAATRELQAAKLALFRSDEPNPPACHGTIPCWREVNGEVVCAFDQSRPKDGVLVGPPEVLTEPRDRFARVLVYRRPDGTEVVVPNAHYNQPVAWRVEHLRWQAEQCRKRAHYHQTRTGAERLAVEMTEQAEQLEKQARELEASCP